MKQDIHPNYLDKVEVVCSCGHGFKVGSTAKKLEVEVCWQCHPFYTGTQKLVDTAGRVGAFKKRLKKVAEIKPKANKLKGKSKKKSGRKLSGDSSVSLNKAR